MKTLTLNATAHIRIHGEDLRDLHPPGRCCEGGEKAATDDSRSVASYVEKLLSEHLKARGDLK